MLAAFSACNRYYVVLQPVLASCLTLQSSPVQELFGTGFGRACVGVFGVISASERFETPEPG